MLYKYLDPEIAGGFGEEAELDASAHPPIVKKKITLYLKGG